MASQAEDEDRGKHGVEGVGSGDGESKPPLASQVRDKAADLAPSPPAAFGVQHGVTVSVSAPFAKGLVRKLRSLKA